MRSGFIKEVFSTVRAPYIAALALTLVALVWADAPRYEPNQVEQLQLQVKQRDAMLARQNQQLAQERLDFATRDFRSALASLNQACSDVVTKHGWPAGTTCDPNTLAFVPPPAPAANEKAPPAK